MVHKILERVQETTISTGTGALVLAGATTRMRGFAAAGFLDGETFLGLIEHASASEWEETLCTYHTSSNSITRATPRKSSTGASAIAFSAGVKTVSLVESAGIRHHAGRSVTSGSTTAMADNDCLLVVDKTVSGAHAVTLPANPLPNQSVCVIDGKGDAETYNITISAADAATINGAASIVIATNYERQWFNWTGAKWLLI